MELAFVSGFCRIYFTINNTYTYFSVNVQVEQNKMFRNRYSLTATLTASSVLLLLYGIFTFLKRKRMPAFMPFNFRLQYIPCYRSILVK